MAKVRKDDVRTLIIKVSVNKHEREVIMKRAGKLPGFSLSSFVRWMALCASLPKTLTVDTETNEWKPAKDGR